MKKYLTSVEDRARRERKFAQQGGLCHWCGNMMSLEPLHTTERGRVKDNNLYATYEHLVRRREGGAGKAHNVVLAHAACNRKREKDWNKLENNK